MGKHRSVDAIDIVSDSQLATIQISPQAVGSKLKSPAKSERVGGWIAVSFSLVGMFACAVLTCVMFWKIRALFPVNHRHLKPWTALLIIYLIGCVLLIGVFIVIACATMVAHGARRVRFKINNQELIEHCRWGIYRRRRQVKIEKIRWIMVHPPGQSSVAQFKGPLARRPAILRLLDNDGNAISLRGQYPHELACDLAEELAAQVSRFSLKQVEEIDAMSPEFLDSDEKMPMPGYHLRVNETAQGAEIVEEFPNRHRFAFLKSKIFWFFVGIALLPIFTWSVTLILLSFGVQPNKTDGKSDTSFNAILIWVMLLPIWLNTRRRRKCFRIGTDLLEIVNAGRERGREYPRIAIEGVRAAHRVSSDGRISTGVALIPMNRFKPFFMTGDVLVMRYLASVLRQYLKVSAQPTSDDNDVDSLAWHMRDSRVRPKSANFFSETKGATTKIVRPARAMAGMGCAMVLFGLFCLAAMVALVVRIFAADPDKRRGSLGAAICFGGFGLLGFFALYCDSKVSLKLIITRETFSRTKTSIFGTRHDQWPRAELTAVGTTVSISTTSDIPLKLAFRNGETKTIFSDDPAQMRYLATLLRDALKLPAIVPDEPGVLQ